MPRAASCCARPARALRLQPRAPARDLRLQPRAARDLRLQPRAPARALRLQLRAARALRRLALVRPVFCVYSWRHQPRAAPDLLVRPVFCVFLGVFKRAVRGLRLQPRAARALPTVVDSPNPWSASSGARTARPLCFLARAKTGLRVLLRAGATTNLLGRPVFCVYLGVFKRAARALRLQARRPCSASSSAPPMPSLRPRLFTNTEPNIDRIVGSIGRIA